MKIEAGKKVKLDVTISVDGQVIESAETRGGPLEYEHGKHSLPLGLEDQLLGLEVGAEKQGDLSVDIPKVEMKKSEFPKDFKLEVGSRFAAKRDGQDVEMEVLEKKGDLVVVRPFHPLAGKTLKYEVKILDVSSAG